jgi:hypothetical protein
VLLLFCMLSIYCWLRSLAASPSAGRWASASYLFLGLGVSFKIVPMAFAPFMLLGDLRALGNPTEIAARECFGF